MKARIGFGLALLAGLAATACGSSSSSNQTDAGGTKDAGTKDAGEQQDAGADAGKFELTGDAGPVEGTGKACSSTSDARPEGKCYGFFCGTNGNSIKAGVTSNSPCKTDAEVFLICDGLGAREAARCARVHALDSDPREGTRMCLRDNHSLDPFTDACLACFLDSSDCAREKCLTECLGGDSPTCDKCREDNGCTPDYYKCSGIPNPM